MEHREYTIPRELLDAILADAGLESLQGDAQVVPLDDNVSQR